VVESAGRIVVAAGDGPVELTELQQEGKSVLGAAEFLNGYSLPKGEMLQ
jgi:methionyl-tRNA formyltransferase